MAPDRHPVSQLPRLRFAFAPSPPIACFGFAMRFATCVWTYDAWRIGRADLGPPRAIVLGLLAGLFRGLFAAFLVALLMAALLWFSALRRSVSGEPRWSARLRGWLLEGSHAQQMVHAGTLLALPGLAFVYALAAFKLSERLIVGMALPEFAAIAIVAGQVLLLTAVVPLVTPLSGLAMLFASQLSRIPWLGPRCFGRTLHYALWLLLGAGVALLVFIVHYWAPLSYLPLAEVAQLTGAAVLAVLLTWAGGRLPARTRRARRVAGLLLFVASFAVAVSLRPVQLRARQIAERESLSGRIGQAALLWVWDRDRDGYLSKLGGGDCAPRDPTRNPGAIDIPGNGIDEDCDGRDLDPKALAPRGMYQYPVPAEVPQAPPIILITVDAFAASHMHALGYGRQLTPHIDAFAARSAFFRHCFSQGPSTRLSFPSMFTSRWDSQIEQELVGKHPFPIGEHELMLAQIVKNAGYDTVAVLPDKYFGPQRWLGITRGFGRVIDSPYTTEPKLPHNGARVTDAAIQELKRTRSRPLFMWVHYYDAHSPHLQPEAAPKYGASRADLYDAELNYVDQQFGRFTDAIEQAYGGKALVLVTGDHGVAFDEPRHQKFNYGYDLYTSVLHVPLIVHAPFVAPRSLDGLVSTMDITPTLVNLLRLPGPFRFEGVSLVPELFTGKSERPAELMHQMFLEEKLWKEEPPLQRVALRTREYDLLHDRTSGFYELYAWQDDYFETHDLALEPAYEAKLLALRQQLALLMYTAQPPTPPLEVEPAPLQAQP
jgi:arylsulfatase A-like enzyme